MRAKCTILSDTIVCAYTKMDINAAFNKCACGVISHTPGVEPASLAVIIAQKVKSSAQEAYVISSNPKGAYSTIGDAPSSSDKVSVFTYETIVAPDVQKPHTSSTPIILTWTQRQRRIDTITGSLLVFDSVNHAVSLIGCKTLRDVSRRNNTIIIMYTLGVSQHHMKAIADHIPHALFANAAFADHGMQLKFELHTTNMSPRQDMLYEIARNDELDIASPVLRDQYNKSQQMCNIAYPTPIHRILGSETHAPNIPSADTIVKEFGNDILVDAEKIRSLVTNIVLNREQRHFVFTRYRYHYGLDMIRSVLQLHGIKVFASTGDMSTADRDLSVKAFNEDSNAPQVFITTVALHNEAPTNISHLHMVDGSLSNSHGFFDRLYKYYNYFGKQLPPSLTIDYYVCQRASGDNSADGVLYIRESDQWYRDLQYWDKTMEVSQPIVITSDGRLSITQ